MAEYFITLPKMDTVHKPNLSKNSRVTDDVKIALQSFDTDGQVGFSSDELFSAFDYFVKKEKEIAVTGKKGDGVISSKDIEKILKTDSRFEQLRQKYNDDQETAKLLFNILMTLSSIVSVDNETEIVEIYSVGFTAPEKYQNSLGRKKADSFVKKTIVEKLNVNGAKIKLYKSSDGEEYVTTADGRRYTKEYAAKYLEYKTEKTWFGWGENKYYVAISDEPKICGDFGLYHQYKIWDEHTNSFKNGERKHIFDAYKRRNY